MMQMKDIAKLAHLTIYHGSPNRNIQRFIINHPEARSMLDYGKGVYFTTNERQAMQWAIKNGNTGAVYEIQINPSQLNIKQFLRYDDEFIRTFCYCRAGLERGLTNLGGFDVIYGCMLDHNKASIERYSRLYVEGAITENEVRANLRKFDIDKDQFCFKLQSALDKYGIHRISYVRKINGKPVYEKRR